MENLTQFDSIVYLAIVAACLCGLGFFAARGVWRWWKRETPPEACRTSEQETEHQHLTECIVTLRKTHHNQLAAGQCYSARETEQAIERLQKQRHALPRVGPPLVSNKTPNGAQVSDKPALDKQRREGEAEATLNGYQPKTDLGRKLIEARKAYAARGGKFLNREELDAYMNGTEPPAAQEPVEVYEPAGTMPVVGDRVTDTDTLKVPPRSFVVARIDGEFVAYDDPKYPTTGESEWGYPMACFHDGGVRVLKRPAPVAREAGESEPPKPAYNVGDGRVETLRRDLNELTRRFDEHERDG